MRPTRSMVTTPGYYSGFKMGFLCAAHMVRPSQALAALPRLRLSQIAQHSQVRLETHQFGPHTRIPLKPL